MNARELIEQNLELIDRLVGRACRRVGIAHADVADVASAVKLALVENEYAILRRYEGRSSLATYLAVVIQRFLADQRERTHGRWRPSPEAQRLGDRAVLIEDILERQRRSVDEALPVLRSVDASITRQEVVAIADRLPLRARRSQEVELPEETVMPLASAERTDTAALDEELRDLSRRAASLLCEVMTAWPADDRLLVRLRFESSLSIADIARLMNVPQRPLYRRLESLLGRLRETFVSAGIDPATAADLLDASPRIEMDFSTAWKNGHSHRTFEEAGRASSEETPS